MAPLRLAFVADIHHGQDSFTKKGSAALSLMADFRRFVAEHRPDAVIDLGDRISDVDHATDLALEREVAEAFRGIDAPVHHLCGNHDRDHLSVAENEDILGQALGHQTLDMGGWRLVLWRADSRIRPGIGFVLTEHDLLWLAGALRQADRPLVIVSHVPVSGHAQTGNYYFERNPASSTYPQAERVRALLRGCHQPIIWISGHVHWNTLTMVDGIAHVTLQSLTETFTTHPEPAGTMALLELSPEQVVWRASGRDSFAFSLTTAELGRRWVVPLPPFAEHPEIRVRRDAAE